MLAPTINHIINGLAAAYNGGVNAGAEFRDAIAEYPVGYSPNAWGLGAGPVSGPKTMV